jgi:small-conductance mechanosensitive channel
VTSTTETSAAAGNLFDAPALSTQALDRLGITLGIALISISAIVLSWRLFVRRIEDPAVRYRARKLTSAAITAAAIVLLILLWAPFSGRLVVLLGLVGVGLALATQSSVASLFGWYAIVSGRLYTIGDRVMVGDVRGEVIDITPTRTKMLEIGGDGEHTWISGRQYTGRQVSVPNKSVLEGAIYNYSADFEYVWDEMDFLVGFDADWQQALDTLVKITHRVVEHHHEQGFAQAERLSRFYPIESFDQELKGYTELDPSGVRVSVRYLAPLQGTRRVRSEITQRLLVAFEQAGIEIIPPGQSVRLR